MNLTPSSRVEREREAHTERDVLSESYRLKAKFPHLTNYPSKKRLYDAINEYTHDLRGKVILDYGCGRGDMSMRYLANGAEKVFAIDISNVYVESLINRAIQAGHESSKCDFRVMDAHQLDFPDETFDLVVGFGILHHLDAEKALREIYRVLRPRGRVLLQEPLADNPLLKIFRKLTPQARTPDESPFTGAQVRALQSLPGWNVQSIYCGLLEMPVSLLTSILIPGHPENVLLRLADRLELLSHRHEWLLSWNQYIAFNLVKT